jgi:type IV pilus assembly protein PilE
MQHPAARNAGATGPRREPSRGFTLVETVVALGVVAVLSGIAYPSLEGHLLRARRTDALVALMQAQLAEERFRANHRTYGSLAEIGMRNVSTSGHYELAVISSTADSYEIAATASGRQARDGACRTLRLAGDGASLSYASGHDASASNAADVNRRCWNQ